MFIHISHIVLKYGDLLQNVIKIPYSSPNEDYSNMTLSSYLAHTDLTFKYLTILLLDKQFIDMIGITMSKIEYELLPKSLIQMFSKNRDIHSHDTRNRNLSRVSTGTKYFTYLSTRI